MKCVRHLCLANMDSLTSAFLRNSILLTSSAFMESLGRVSFSAGFNHCTIQDGASFLPARAALASTPSRAPALWAICRPMLGQSSICCSCWFPAGPAAAVWLSPAPVQPPALLSPHVLSAAHTGLPSNRCHHTLLFPFSMLVPPRGKA